MVATDDRPLCECHGLPMYSHRSPKYGPYWRCRVRESEQKRDWYRRNREQRALKYLHVVRPKKLLEQRERILDQLRQLPKEPGID